MKTLLIIFSFLLLLGCDGTKPTTKGVENEASLVFVGQPLKYSDGITFQIDENETCKAEVSEDFKEHPVGKVYGVPSGKHFVTVLSKSQIIFKKQILIKAQEVRKIMLP